MKLKTAIILLFAISILSLAFAAATFTIFRIDRVDIDLPDGVAVCQYIINDAPFYKCCATCLSEGRYFLYSSNVTDQACWCFK